MQIIYELLPEIHFLLNYRADERNYGMFDTNIILCCHKINDIYWTYCIARSNLHYIDNEDFGDFASDENSILFVKSQLIQNALNYYNIIIDLSWQFVWLYFETASIGKLPTHKLYDDIVKCCNYDSLRYRLTLAKDIKLREDYIENFFNHSLVQELRELYNFMKHRGAFYIPGLGMNDSQMMTGINGMDMPLVYRRKLDISELKNKLVEFDKLYFIYITNIIKIYMPNNFLEVNDFFSSAFNYYLKYKEQLIEWNKKQNH